MNKNLPIPKNEVARLDALAQYNILDTLPEEEFDRITKLASIICEVPIALITLINKDRQWFKSKIGLDTTEMPRDISFCQYTINGESLLEIEDATKDERFLSNPLVTAQPNIRFYAGFPLIDPDGYALGSLCVIDREARKLTANQKLSLTLLANEVVSQIVSRKKNAEKKKLKKLFELSIDMKCIIGSNGYFKKLNPSFSLTLGWTIEELLAKPFYDFIHPDDVISSINEIKKIATGEKTIGFENRLISKKGDYVPMSWNANNDKITEEIYAVARDITERKKAEEALTEYKQFFYNTANFSCIANVEGYFEVINSNFEKSLGYSESELLESQFLSFVHPDDIDLTLKEIEKLQKGAKTINFANRYRKKDGNYLWFDWNTTPNAVTGKLYAVARDITEQKKIKKSLEESFSNMEAVLESTADGILVVNNFGNIVRFNKKFLELWKIPKHSMASWDCNKALDTILDQLIYPQKVLAKVKKLYANPKLISFDIIELKDGRVFERYSHPTIVNGVNTGRVWSYRNVTERINTEKTKQQLFALIETSQDFIAFGDMQGNPTFMNKAAREHLGIDDKKLLSSLKISEFMDPKELKIIKQSFLKANVRMEKDGKWEGEAHLLNIKTKKKIPVQMSAFLIRDSITGKAIGLGNVSRDITERQKEELLRKVLQEKYQNIINNMNLGLLEVDNNEIIQYANQSFVDISGYEISELLGKTPNEVFIFGENLAIINSKIQLGQQGKSDSYEIQVKNKRGELRWWAISGASNYDDNDNLLGSIGIYLDITDQKLLDINLEAEKKKAQEASKAKESFLANMSHEIRTPLNAIIGFLRELEKQELSGLQKKYIDNSSIASTHLLDILNTILDLSKIEAGEMSLESEDFLIEEPVNNVLKVLNLKAEQKEIRLTSIISDKVNKVFKGDSLRLEQILFNLIGNALKFTPKGKIKVNCELLSDGKTSQIILISVADTGIGMEQKYAESIFEKFSQEDKSITRKHGGTGLGMAITKELVHLMGGKIEVESEKNKGTTIFVKINLIKGNIESVKKSPSEINFNLDGLSILLVEDNEMNRMVVQNSLQYFNCNITEAVNGFEAVKILKTQNFDLILMDIQMPGMDGIEATKVIREELKLSTPIIALTANAFKTEIEKCKQVGMNDYVTKPFDEIVLLHTIVKNTINKNGVPSLDNEMNPNQSLYNLNVLRDLSRGNDEFVLKMVGVFVEQTIATIEKIDAALESNNFLEISRLIHKIRPSTDNMGVLSIQSEMKTLEKIAKETQNKGQITAIYTVVKKTLQLVIFQLQKNE